MALKRRTIAVVASVVILSGCANAATKESNNQSESESIGLPVTANDNTNNETKTLSTADDITDTTADHATDRDVYTPDNSGSDVVLYFGSDMFSTMGENRLYEVNSYLKKKGCNYRVSFVDLTQTIPFENGTREYAKTLEEYLDNAGCLDLCYLTSMYDNSNITAYDILAEDGYLEDLELYMDIDELSGFIPKVKLDALKRNGKLYGINGYAYSNVYHVALGFNKSLVDKYDLFDKISNKTISELLPILRDVQAKEEASNSKFNAVLFNMPAGSTLLFSNCYQVNPLITGVCLDEKDINDPVKCIFDQEDCINTLREAYSIVTEKGISSQLNPASFDFDDCFMMVSFMGALPGDANAFSADNYPQDLLVTGDDIVISQPYGRDFRVRDELSATAVLKASKNKEFAADFLYRIMTDSELTDIIEYGPDRIVIDEKMYIKDGEQYVTPSIYPTWLYANGFISTPIIDEFDNKRETLSGLFEKHGYVSCYKGFRFEGAGYSDIIASSERVIERAVTDMLENDVGEFNDYITKMKEEYLKNGGGEVLNAVKEQYQNDSEKK